jgi:hypothetical protein
MYVLGIISIQSYLNATRIFVNPSIPEIASFKERYGSFFVFCIVFYIFHILINPILPVLE